MTLSLQPLCRHTCNGVKCSDPGKILMSMLWTPGISHNHMLVAIGAGMVERGHVLHLVATSLRRDEREKLLSSCKASYIVYYDSAYSKEGIAKETAEAMAQFEKSGPGPGGFSLLMHAMKYGSDDCRALFSDSKALARLKQESYDLMITEVFYPCDVLLAHYLNVPFVALSSTRELPILRKSFFGFPSELSYIPETFFGATDKMNYIERVQNVFHHFFLTHVVAPILLSEFTQIQKDFDLNPETYLTTMIGRAALWLSYSDISLDFAEPVMPNYVPIGGLAVKDAKALDKELEDFVQGSGCHGIIVFSLGSTGISLGNTKQETLARVFSRFPQRVIWKHDGDTPSNLGNNTKIMKWMPQNDLLGHSKTRLFIGHGGLNGVYEAMYHKVPMILIPLAAPDQYDNAARVEAKGMGLHLASQTITEDTLYEAMSEVLGNKRYKERVSHYSEIFRDLPPAKERAIFWIEHVMKYGDEHLRARVFELNWIQYYMIDVAVFVILLAFMFVYVFRFICSLCWTLGKRVLGRNDTFIHSKSD